MTVSVSQLAHFTARHSAGAKGAATGASGNTGSSDGLGDFMALLDQLGITVGSDGTASGDILALLGKADALGKDGLAGLTAKLDTLSAKTGQATAASNALLAALGTQAEAGDGASDPATALAELLNAIDAKSDAGDDTPAATTDGPDMSQLLALIGAMAAKAPPVPAPAVTTAVTSDTVAAATAKPAKAIPGIIGDMTAKLRSDLKSTAGDAADDHSISLAEIKARFKDQLEAWSAARRPGSGDGDGAGNASTSLPADKRLAEVIARLNVQVPVQSAAPAAVAALLTAADSDGPTDNTAVTATPDAGLIATDALLGATTTTPPVATATPGDSVAVGRTDFGNADAASSRSRARHPMARYARQGYRPRREQRQPAALPAQSGAFRIAKGRTDKQYARHFGEAHGRYRSRPVDPGRCPAAPHRRSARTRNSGSPKRPSISAVMATTSGTMPNRW